MANNKNRNDVKKNASTLNSGWLKNTLKSMGVASTEMIKDIMPATSETLHSAGELTNDAIKTVRSTRVGAQTLADSISKSSAVKMSQDFFKNALEDIKSGNLYNTERERPLDGFDDSDMDMETLFGDMDDFSFDEEGENPNINVVNQEINRGVDNAATIKAIERGTEYNVRATKATVDTMVSIASTNMLNNNKIGTEVLSQLSSINSNLAALIEYNNTNMTKFIDASIGYYEQMSKPLSGGGYGRFSGDERITADEIYGSHGGLDFKNYKEYVKANIIDMKNMSMVGSMLSMIAENKEAFFGDIIANPIGTILKGTMKAAIPQVTKTAMAALDESIKDFIPVMLERIGGLDEMEGPFSGIASAIAGAFGVKTKRKKNFDLTKIEKGPMPYNGYANHTIVEIIPKYLRESNAYLREIAEAVTGKNSDQITKNSTGFDWETGTFKNLDEMRQKVYDEIEARTTYEFRNSKFGEKMSSQKYLLKSSKDQENYDQALDQLYGMIEKHRGPIDFKNKEHMDEIMGGINASDSIKNLIESYIEHLQETSDEAIGSAIAAKQKATRERNQAMKDVEMSATEKGIRQFVGNGSYDAYIKEKYNGSKGASVDSSRKGMSKVNVSVPSLLQGIQDTLNRGIYVQIKHKLGDKSDSSSGSSPSYDSGSGRSRRRGRRVNVVPTESTPQTKDEFKTAFAEEANNQAELDEMFSESDSLSTRERFGQSSAKHIGMFKGVIDGIMAGNSDKAFDEFINGMRAKLRQAGEFLSEHFFTPIKNHIFGEKNEDGYIEGGLFSGINNRMKESFYSLRRMITGKGYIDAEGNRVEDANEEEMKNTVSGKLKGMLIGLKEGIHEKLFGKKAENENEDDKEGLLPKAKKKLSNGVSSLLKGLTGWKHALFGESDDEDSDPEEEGKKTLEKMTEKAKDVLPSALTGTLVGSVGGTVAGGYLGMMVGGPIGGALLGLAGGIASRSEKFKDWLFGPEDKDGKRIGGVISENVQDYMKANGKYIAGGAALGMLRAGLTSSSGGILGTLVGGPLAGAILGMGTSMLIKSEMFQKFLFGDEKTGQKGLVKTVKSWFGGLGRNKAGDPSGGKLAGMMGIGAGVGAITLGTLTNVGFLGLSLGPAGPIGGALLGLGTAILAQRKNFKEWLFGKVDPDTGEKREGILGKFKNMMYATVFLPMKNTVKDLGRRFKTFFYYDVLGKFNLIIEPIGNMLFGGISKLTGHAIDSLAGLGDVIKEDFLMPALEKARKLLAPVTTAVNTIAKGIYTVGTNIIKAPINLLYAITSPIAQAVGKTVKGVASTVAATVNYAIVKPIKNLVIKPLVGAVSLATKIITKPFEIVGSAVSFVSKKISDFSKHVSIFMHNVGQDLKEWIFKKNPIAKGIRNFGKRVKDFGARIKNTFKILVRPLTEFVTTALSEVKNHLVNGISKFFSMLNPINWIKGIYSLLTGKKKDKDPTKMGYLRRAWYEAGEFGLKDAPEGLADEGSYRQRRNALKQAKKHFRQKVTYYAEDGTAYVQSKNGQYYQVTNPDGSPAGTIPASDLPDKTTLTKKVEGISGQDENNEKRYIERERQKNIAAIGKMTGWQRKDDTLESREIAKAMAAKKGKVLKINEAIDTEDAEIRMREARLQQDTLDATEDIKDNTYESSNVLKHILDTLTFGLTMSPEEKQKLREHKQIIKRKAAFLGGYDGEQAKEDEEEARKAAEELAAHQAATLESEGYRGASRRGKKKTDNKYSKIRRNIYEDNYTRHGFFGGLKASFNNLTGYVKGGLSQIWTKGEIPDELKDEENNDAEVPKHATGTRYAKRGPAIVGENGPEAMYRNGASTGRIVGMNGPEVINLQGGETIIPNDKIGSKSGDTTQSNLTDESIMKATDSRKLGLGERILRELMNIKNNTSTMTNPEITINGTVSSDVDYEDGEYDTTNLRRLGRGISSGFNGIVNRLPGVGLVRKGARSTKGTVMAGKSVVGASGELFKMIYGKSRKLGRGIRSFGKRLRKRTAGWLGSTTLSGSGSGDDSDSGDSDDGSGTGATVNEEREEKENDSQLAVSSLTAENRHAEVMKREEEESDDARGDAILKSINNIERGQKEYSDLWNSIFGKKGLITGGLLLLAPYLFKFLKSFPDSPIFGHIKDIFSNLKTTLTEWWDGVKEDFGFGLDNLGDGASVKDKIIDNLERGFGVYDENGNSDHQTDARKKLRDKTIARTIATFFGKNDDGLVDKDSTKRGANTLYTWGKDKLNKIFGTQKSQALAEYAEDQVEGKIEGDVQDAVIDRAESVLNNISERFGTDAASDAGAEIAQDAVANRGPIPGQLLLTGPVATDVASDAGAEIAENLMSSANRSTIEEVGSRAMGEIIDVDYTEVIDDVASRIGREAGTETVERGMTAAVREGTEATAARVASEDSLWKKVVDMIKRAFNAIRDKVIKKSGGSRVAEAAVRSAPDDVMEQVGKCQKFFPEVSAKISSILGVTAGLGATVIGLAAKESTWIAIGALNGLTGAAKLFRVDKPDNLMIMISGVIGALAGTTVGSIIDVINELTVSVLGIDIVSQLASLIYTAIMRVSGNEEAADTLRKAQDEFKQKFEKDKTAEITEQYKTMQAAGIIGRDVTLDKFIEGANNGEYGAHITSFADYNDEQHKNVGDKISDSMHDSLSDIKTAFIGSKKVVYTDKKGNVYTQNDDGTYQVKNKSGKDLGYVGEDAIPEDADKVVEKTEGALIKLGKQIVKTVTPFIKMLIPTIPEITKSIGHIIAGHPIELLKSKINIDDKVPMSGIAKALCLIPKLTGFVPATMSWLGLKLLKPLTSLIGGTLDMTSDLATNLSDNINYMTKGDIDGLWSSGVGKESSGIFGIWSKALGYGMKASVTPITLVSWIGHELWNGFRGFKEGAVTLFHDNMSNFGKIWDYIKGGHPVEMWKDDVNISEDNPLSVLTKIASAAAKTLATPFALIGAAFHALADPVKQLGNTISIDWGKFKKTAGDALDAGMDGDVNGVWNASLTCEDDDILSPLFHFGAGITKILGTIVGVVMWLPEKMKSLVDKVKDVSVDIADWTRDKWNWLTGKDPDELKDLRPTTYTTVKNQKSDEVGGNGFGLIKHLRGGMGDGPSGSNDIPDEMNGMKYFSQNDPRWANDDYQNNSDNATIADSGCGPTAMAMIASEMSSSQNITPVSIAKTAIAGGYRDETGTNKEFVQNAAEINGLAAVEHESPTIETIKHSLLTNEPVLMLGQSDGSPNSPYTVGGHYVVANGISGNNVLLNDPRGVQYSQPVNIARLASQTSSVWTFSRKKSGDLDGSKHDRDHGQIVYGQILRRSKKKTGGRGGVDPQTIIDIALGEVGYKEHASNSGLDSNDENVGSGSYNKYSRDLYSKPQMDWCAAFVTWCFYKALDKNKDSVSKILHNTKFGSTSSCSSIKKAFKSNKSYHTNTPSPGDLIFFDWGSNSGDVDHIGIVVGFDGKTITSCEGNSGDSSRGYDSVCLKAYSIDDGDIDGFGTPNYSGTISWDDVKRVDFLEISKNNSDTKKGHVVTSIISDFSSMISKFATAIFKGAITGNWDIDWDSIFSDGSSEQESSSDATIQESPTDADEGNELVLDNEADARRMYKFLLSKGNGLSHQAVSAIMGNLYGMSELRSNNLEDSAESKLKTTDIEFTEKIDKNLTGQESKVAKALLADNDYGYGVANFKSKLLKEKLFDMAAKEGTSISDPIEQLQILYDFLKANSPDMLHSDDLRKASDAMINDYQRPEGDFSTISDERYNLSKLFYDKFKDIKLDANSSWDTLQYYGKDSNGGKDSNDRNLEYPFDGIGLSESDKAILKNINDYGLSNSTTNVGSAWDAELRKMQLNHTINSDTIRSKADDTLMKKREELLTQFYRNKGYKVPKNVLRELRNDGSYQNLILAVLGKNGGAESAKIQMEAEENAYDTLSRLLSEEMKKDKKIKEILEYNSSHAYSHPLTSEYFGDLFYMTPDDRSTIDLLRIVNGMDDVSENAEIGQIFGTLLPRTYGKYREFNPLTNNPTDTFSSYEYADLPGSKEDLLAFDFVKDAAVKGLRPAVNYTMDLWLNTGDSKDNPTSEESPWNVKNGHITDDEWTKIENHSHEYSKASAKSDAVRAAEMVFGWTGLLFPEVRAVYGGITNITSSKLLKGASKLAGIAPVVGGATKKSTGGVADTIGKASWNSEAAKAAETVAKDTGKGLTKRTGSKLLAGMNTKFNRVTGAIESLGMLGGAYFGPDVFIYDPGKYELYDYAGLLNNGNDMAGYKEFNPDSVSLIKKTRSAYDTYMKRKSSKGIHRGSDDSSEHGGTHGGFGTGPTNFGGRGDGVPNTLNKSTYYSQNDPRWSNDKFVRSDGADDGATIGNSGCGPTAMAMALSDATGTTVKPTETAKLAQVMGDRDETGVNWNFINNAANYYGVNTLQSTNPSRQFIESSLDTGSPVVLSGQSYGDVNSPYTSGGHYVVAVGKDGRGNVIINDPRGKNYSKHVNIDTLVNSTNSAWLIGKNTSKNSLQYTTKKYKKRGGKGGVTANDVVTVAANERGYLEKVPGALDSQLDDKTGNANLGPSGSERVKYYRDLNLGNGGYWCAAFVSWCVWSATGQNMSMTRDLMCGGVSASCNTILNNFKAKGQWYTDKPAIGDLILFNWADSGDPLADHIGIVSNIDSEYVYTIEGNSGNPNGDANGRPDGVFDHKYKLSDPQIMGYCRPKYDGTPNFGGITMQYDATLSESSQSNDPSSLFSKAGEAIFKAAYTGNWDIDWDSVFASTSVSSNSSYSSDGAVVNNEVIKGNTIKVPKDVQTGITENYTNYDYWYPKWASSTNQRLIADAWAKKGRKQDRGIAMLDGNYLLAMSPKFGTTGDIVNIKLEDGESFNAILGDSKGADAQSEWGHSFGNSGKADIIEWEACVGSDSATGRGHDGISLEGNWKGKYIDSVTNGGSYMDRIQGGKGDGPVRSGSSKPKKRGGHGEGPSLKTNKYSTPRTNNNYENDYEQSVLVMDKTDIGMTAQQREVVNNTSSYGDENLEKLMREVINILGVISNNSGNLTLLKDIKSGLSGNNTVVSNTTNTTVNANGKSKSKQTMQTNARMSRNEEAARKIAFGG